MRKCQKALIADRMPRRAGQGRRRQEQQQRDGDWKGRICCRTIAVKPSRAVLKSERSGRRTLLVQLLHVEGLKLIEGGVNASEMQQTAATTRANGVDELVSEGEEKKLVERLVSSGAMAWLWRGKLVAVVPRAMKLMMKMTVMVGLEDGRWKMERSDGDSGVKDGSRGRTSSSSSSTCQALSSKV